MVLRSISYLNNIRAERVRHGLTQIEMAEKMEMSLTAYSGREQGKYPFTVEELMRIANLLNTTCENLLGKPS